MSSSPEVRYLTHQNNIDWQRSVSLSEYESTFMNDQDEHPWWSFFDSGVQDEEGAVWAVYNRWCEETQTNGWRVVRCPSDQTRFREIPITRVVRRDVYPAVADKDGLTTFQLSIYDKATGFANNDVLNVLLYHNHGEVKPKLSMWNQTTTMRPLAPHPQVALEGAHVDYGIENRSVAAA
jgi:hypothetical protein